jgi:5,10-methylenetetrahydromethanopterin reductase
MDYGIALATTTESWKVVKRAEELGFSHAWFYDTQLLNPDVFIGMAQAAMHTTRIRLGTGVLIPSNRIEPVTANALATLNRLAPGRIDFGVGTGFTGRRTMDMRAIPLQRMKRYVQRVQGLLAGEVVTGEHEGGRQNYGFLNPDLGLINIGDPVALHVSALGPQARRLVAELDAGWINFTADERTATRTLRDMQGAWQAAGRPVGAFTRRCSCWVRSCGLASGMTPSACWRRLGLGSRSSFTTSWRRPSRGPWRPSSARKPAICWKPTGRSI